MTRAQLLEEFRIRLGNTQLPAQVSLFEGDLLRSNLDVMSAALTEARVIASRSASPPRNAREAVLALYSAKIAEIAQLFPIFFIFESAFRSFVAARLDVIYADERWWKPIQDAVTRGTPAQSIQSLGQRRAARDVKDTVEHLFKGLGRNAVNVSTTYELLDGGTLAHVERLIDQHWSDMRSVFHQSPGAMPITGQHFRNHFRIVRQARNDAYHHRTVAGRPRMVAIAEELLDLLDIHLSTRLQQVTGSQLPPLQFVLRRTERHA